jgi:hypothetical protein
VCEREVSEWRREKVKGSSMRTFEEPPSPVRYIRTKNVVEGVKIFKTYMNMMSEKVLILLCDVHSSFLIYFSLLLHIYTHLHTPKIPFFQFYFIFFLFMLYCCCWCCSAVIKLLLTKNFTNEYRTYTHKCTHPLISHVYDVLEK